MKSWVKLLLLGGAAIAAAEAYLRAAAPSPPAGAAPPFALPDLAGRTVRLEALRGRVVALNFWASWCGPCREEIPDLVHVHGDHQADCLAVLGVAEESGGRDDVAEAARRFGITYPVLIDPGGDVGVAYRVPGYPRTVLVDHEGQVRRTFTGAVTRDELEAALRPLLAATPRPCPPLP